MGLTNIKQALETKLSHYRGELDDIRQQIETIENGVASLRSLQRRSDELRDQIVAVEKIIQFDHPDWTPVKVKSIKKRRWNSPFPSGSMGRYALDALREDGGWLRTSEIARIILEKINHDPDDRQTREKVANSLGNYLKKYDGDLVECTDEFAKRWRVIRKTE